MVQDCSLNAWTVLTFYHHIISTVHHHTVLCMYVILYMYDCHGEVARFTDTLSHTVCSSQVYIFKSTPSACIWCKIRMNKSIAFLVICLVSLLLTEAARFVDVTGKRINPVVNNYGNNLLLISGGKKSRASNKETKIRRNNKNTRRQKRRQLQSGPTLKKRLEEVAVQGQLVYKDMFRRAKVSWMCYFCVLHSDNSF